MVMGMIEQWIAELEFWSCQPVFFSEDSRKHYGPGQELIDRRVTDWLRREARALRFRKMLYGA